MKTKMYLFLFFCLFASSSMGQEEFCGSVRMKCSQNLIMKEIKVEGRGLTNRLAEKIAQKIIKKKMAPLLKQNGNYDKFVKTKGNKAAFYDTKGVSLMIYDGDAGVTYTIYPSYKIGAMIKNDPAEQAEIDSTANQIVFSEPQETDATFMGYKCKLVEATTPADTTLHTRFWVSDQFVMPKGMDNVQTGKYGTPLAYSMHADNQVISMDMYYEIVELIPGDIPDSVFEIPADIKMVPFDKLSKYLSKKQKGEEAKAEIPLTGAAMPDSFWNF